jgi:hypothetical protein
MEGGGTASGGAGGGGGGGGVSACGADAGTPVPDAFSILAPRVCEDSWLCAATSIKMNRLPAPPQFSVVDISIDGGVVSSGVPAWRGGVLLPTGKVLLTPFNADHFVLVDPDAREAYAVGAKIDLPTAQRYGATILGCDGVAYALPYGDAAIRRIEPDGVSYPLSSPSANVGHIGGAVLRDSCAGGYVHVAAAGDNQWFDITISVSQVDSVCTQSLNGSPQGAAMLGDVWFMPVGANCFTVNNAPLPPCPQGIPLDAGTVYFGGALTSDGRIAVLNTLTGAIESYDSMGNFTKSGTAIGHARWPLARGDGFIYALGANLMAIDDRLPANGETVVAVLDGGNFSGLVNTLNGSLVGVPQAGTVVKLFVPPDGGFVPPAEVVLSPYLNKL